MTGVGMRFKYIGYSNFTEILFSQTEFTTEMISYLVSTIISVPIIVVFALIIAIMLNQNVKGKGFFRLIFFLPVIIVSGPILGMLNQEGAGSLTSIDTQAITATLEATLPGALADPISDLFENMVTILWYSGVQILIFISSLQKIDRSMYEAAKIDGGSGWECFWKITLPNNEQNSIIGLIQDSMFSGTQEKGYGYASAMAWMYSIVVVLMVALFAALFMSKKDVYEKQVKKAKKAHKKEQRQLKQIERRSAKNAKKNAKAARG